MTTQMDIPIEERIKQLLEHLGIEKAHFGARVGRDWNNFTTNYSERVASMILICPPQVEPEPAEYVANRLLVFTGDQGGFGAAVQRVVSEIDGASCFTFDNYFGTSWTDVVADHRDEIGEKMLHFISQRNDVELQSVELSEVDGMSSGLNYSIRGSGPPLILFPLALSPSQWEPLIPYLSKRFCTVTVSGSNVGMVPLLEDRGRSGYLGVFKNLISEIDPQPGKSILDVGCGTGVLVRWLAHHTKGLNRIMSVDINSYLLKEAQALINDEGLEKFIELRQADAENLPFPDYHFDSVVSSTVLEEVDANKVLTEMIRVVKPEGKVGVVVRSTDMQRFINLPISQEIRDKLQAPGLIGGGVVEFGCGDSSVYTRFQDVGLTQIKMLPQLAAMTDGPQLRSIVGSLMPYLSPDELKEWDAAMEASPNETFFIAQPFHCAVGTKPE